MPSSRTRETKETKIDAFLDVKGQGQIQVETGIDLLDEILSAICKGGGFDLKVKARGDLETGDHHTTEDVAITLGSLLSEEITGGIGSSIVPSGLSVATVAVRFGEPGYQGNFILEVSSLAGMDLENFSHMLRALAYNGRFNLAISATGGDDRSKIEAMSTALGRAIKKAAKGRI